VDSILRAAAIYSFVWLFIRISGKRTLSELNTFDFVLLLIIGESTQQALIGNDFSVVNAATIIITLVGIDILVSFLKQRSSGFEKWMDGCPVILLEHGRPLQERMQEARVDEAEILEAARRLQGLERLEQIKYAVLERSGGITIIPEPSKSQPGSGS
jgi:uncharacterized membrane protein YcaP (DUF421 family)